jgi:hypothetical protein
MDPTRQANPVAELVQSGAAAVERWLGEVCSGARPAPPRFNWLLLAEAASTESWLAARVDDRPAGLAWARVAIAAYDLLAARAAANAHFQTSHECAAMRVRVSRITALGPAAGDPVLDPSRVVRWFFDRLSLTPDEAVERTAWFMHASDEERRRAYRANREWHLEAYRVRQRLQIIRSLVDLHAIQPQPDLQAWLALPLQFYYCPWPPG